MNQALALRHDGPYRSNYVPAIPSEHEMMVYHTMAKSAVNSKMYRGLGEEPGVMMIMLAARELSIPPMQALNGGINIIQGKVEISARMMSALIRKAGHSIQIIESHDFSCTVTGTRSDNNNTCTETYTLEEAQKAGLIKNGGAWTKCPKDMCYNRALSRLARRLFSDVIGIGYIEGEIKAVDHVQEVVDIQPELPKAIEHTPEMFIQLKNEYLSLFQKGEINLAMQYLEVVCNHFKWEPLVALQEMLKDPKGLIEKFNKWKSKISTESND